METVKRAVIILIQRDRPLTLNLNLLELVLQIRAIAKYSRGSSQHN